MHGAHLVELHTLAWPWAGRRGNASGAWHVEHLSGCADSFVLRPFRNRPPSAWRISLDKSATYDLSYGPVAGQIFRPLRTL